MQPIATDDPVSWCVCLSRGSAVQKQLNGSRSQRIEVPFGAKILGEAKYTVLNGGPNLLWRGKVRKNLADCKVQEQARVFRGRIFPTRD